MNLEQKKEFWSQVDDWTLQNSQTIMSTWDKTEREIIRREIVKRKLKQI
jgi:hypothetical protein